MVLGLDANRRAVLRTVRGMSSGEESKKKGHMKSIENTLLVSVRSIIERARKHVHSVANAVLLESYWQIGKLIMEDEQAGLQRAGYGKGTLKKLSQQLTMEFGKGFDERNPNNMRAFYLAFPIWYAVRTELSWTHYRILSRIADPSKREHYLGHCGHVGWDSRTLQRNINSMYFERAISLPAKDEPQQPVHHIKDPYIFEFLNIPVAPKIREGSLESSIIDHLKHFLLELGKGFAWSMGSRGMDG